MQGLFFDYYTNTQWQITENQLKTKKAIARIKIRACGYEQDLTPSSLKNMAVLAQPWLIGGRAQASKDKGIVAA